MQNEEQSCLSCAKRGTRQCKSPEWCIAMGHADYKNEGLGDVCPHHGQTLHVQKTDTVNGSNVVYTWKICRICGYRVKITFDAVELEPSKVARGQESLAG